MFSISVTEETIKGTRKKFSFPVIGKRIHAANNIDKFYNSWLENQMGISGADKLCTVNVAGSSKEDFTNDSISYMDFFGNRESVRNILKIEGKFCIYLNTSFRILLDLLKEPTFSFLQ